MIFIIDIVPLNNQNIETFEKFLVKQNNYKKANILPYGAKYKDIPCGAILGELGQKNGEKFCKISSFFVLPFFRRKGVGTELLNTIKNRVIEFGIKKILVNAITSQEKIEQLEKFLLKRGFSKPKLLTEVYLFDPKALLKENKLIQRILDGNFELPEKIKILSKNNVSKGLLDKVKNRVGIDYPESLSPFANEFDLDNEFTKFAVFDNKEIVAWLTAFKAPQNSILYRSFFVKEDFRKTALGYILFNSVVKLHAEKYVDKKILYAVAVGNVRTQKLFSLYFKNLYNSKLYEFEMTS